MHEQHLMQDVMRQIDSVVSREQAGEVLRVRVWLGALSHFSAASFTEHFRRLAAGSCMQNASLELTKSEDIHHPDAQGVIIESIDVSLPVAGREGTKMTCSRSREY